jgi:hypothetical protein
MKDVFSSTAAVSDKILWLTPVPAETAVRHEAHAPGPKPDDLFAAARAELARSRRGENLLYLILAFCYLMAAANFFLACL